MADSNHLEILKKGVEAWNLWRHAHPNVRPDLTDSRLEEIDLDVAVYVHPDSPPGESADPYGVNFSKALLDRCTLGEIELWMPEFDGASLAHADLSKTRIHMGNFRNASLQGADLTYAQFWNCDLTRTDFSEALIWDTLFSDIDLSSAVGLERIRQQGPAQIALSSLYRSRGVIPDAFLRAAAVPEGLISYIRSLTETPIRFYSCFISHSAKDQKFCDRLAADLRARGVQVWYFPENAVWGKKVWAEIDQSIKIYDKVVLVCSRHSLKSGPVQREIERALNREDRENKDVLFPIAIDDYVFIGWEHARKDDVLQKVVGDFKGWETNPNQYDSALTKLVKALESNGRHLIQNHNDASVSGPRPATNEVDKKTWIDFIEIVPSNGSIGFLRETNFAGFSFDWRRLKDLERFLDEHSGPEHEFLNPELELARKTFQESAKTFLAILAQNTAPTHREHYQAVPEHWETEHPEQFKRAVSEIHKSADGVGASYDALVRLVRRTLAL